jgi:hypothetical protein
MEASSESSRSILPPAEKWEAKSSRLADNTPRHRWARQAPFCAENAARVKPAAHAAAQAFLCLHMAVNTVIFAVPAQKRLQQALP